MKEENPEFIISYASVSGEIGNYGQSDYAAANGYESEYMFRYNKETGVRALAVCWDIFWMSETSARLIPLESIMARFDSAGVRPNRSPSICWEADSRKSGSLMNKAAQGLD